MERAIINAKFPLVKELASFDFSAVQGIAKTRVLELAQGGYMSRAETIILIVTTNLRFGDWNSIFGDEIMTTALLDRLTHKAHILEFIGESYRFRQRMRMEEQVTSTETG